MLARPSTAELLAADLRREILDGAPAGRRAAARARAGRALRRRPPHPARRAAAAGRRGPRADRAAPRRDRRAPRARGRPLALRAARGARAGGARTSRSSATAAACPTPVHAALAALEDACAGPRPVLERGQPRARRAARRDRRRLRRARASWRRTPRSPASCCCSCCSCSRTWRPGGWPPTTWRWSPALERDGARRPAGPPARIGRDARGASPLNHDRADGVRPPARLMRRGVAVPRGRALTTASSATRCQRNARRSESERNPVHSGRDRHRPDLWRVRSSDGRAWLPVGDETNRHRTADRGRGQPRAAREPLPGLVRRPVGVGRLRGRRRADRGARPGRPRGRRRADRRRSWRISTAAGCPASCWR